MANYKIIEVIYIANGLFKPEYQDNTNDVSRRYRENIEQGNSEQNKGREFGEGNYSEVEKSYSQKQGK